MWKIKKIDSQEFLLNLQYDDSRLKLCITDLKGLWFAELNDNEMLDIFRKLNPLVEGDTEELKLQIRRMLDTERTDVDWTIEMQELKLILNIKATASWMPFNFCVVLGIVNNEEYFKTIVLPLLIIIRGNQKQFEHLCNIIKKKDSEIEEYKMNGAVLTRKAVITPKFDQSILNNVFQENLRTVTADISDNYLDQNIEYYYNEVNKFSNENQSKTVKLEVKVEPQTDDSTEETNIQQKPKEDSYCVDLQRKGKITDISPTSKPIFRSKPKVVKKLNNL